MNLLLLPGDGIGPETMAVTVEVLSRLDRRRHSLGLKFETHGALATKAFGALLAGLLEGLS